METLVKEKILEQFVKEIPRESATIQPINVDIKSTDVTRMTNINTLKTNDGNYFIRYGGFVTSSSYNAIEVYSVNSLDNNAAIYVFDNLQIDNHTFFIQKMKQSEDGRFYAVAQYYDGSSSTNYLIIFNNFIQDGYCQINKYYTASNIGTSDSTFYDVTKVKDAGVYFILTESHLVRFEINILEGNKINIATIVNGGTITSGSYQPQLNILKDKLIFTKLWNVDVTPSGQPPYTKYEYTKAVVNINGDFPNTITLNQIYTTNITIENQIDGAINQPFEVIIPYLISGFTPSFTRVRLDGTIVSVVDRDTRIFSLSNPYFCIQEEFAALSNNGQLYLFYFKEDKTQMYNFYTTTFTKYFSQYEVIKQYDMITLIGSATLGTQQSIVSIKNIYSPNTTSLPYYTDQFCLPAYMNLYSDSNDDTSLIFSRDATARFYSGNQVTSTFIVPNYLLNDGNIEKASVYGRTNYLLNSEVEDYQKNRFESLYFNFIYSLNVIDNTNGLNTLNQIGSNKVANGLWKTFDNYDLRLTKARITYEDLSTEIIELTLVNVVGGTAIFNYNVNGNITQIEYLSNDESTVYATYKRKISGSHTITQVVKTIPNDIGTANGTSIYINDSSSLRFANIIIDGNTTQNGTPTPSNQVPINSAGDNINLFDKTANITRGYTYTSTGGTTQLNNCFVQEKYIEVESSKEYILSTTNSYISETDYRLVICEYNSSKNFIKRNLSSTQYYKITTSATTKYVRLCASTVTIDELKFEHGSIATPYSPYGMGSINEVISNKNLFNMDGKPSEDRLSSAGYTLKYNDDKTITINGTGTGTYKFLSWDLTLEAGTYIASGCPSGGSQNGYSFLIRVGNSSYWDYGNGVSFTLIEKTTIQVHPIRLGSTIPTFNNVTFKPMIRLASSSATSFVPHQEQNISIPCQQPMRSIGNVRDTFVKVNGVWYEKHNIGQVIFNGSENWNITNDGSFKRFSTLISDLEQFTVRKSNLLSNYYIGSTTSNVGIIFSYDKHVWLYPTSDITSVDAFKTWLSTHNTEVIYQLAEPIYLECTEEQITALENMLQCKTYESVTNINSLDTTPAYLNVTYYKQL